MTATLRQSLSHEPLELSFGTSGLRGLVTNMTDLECYINAAGFLHFLEEKDGLKKNQKIYLAGDLRDSTPRIMRAVAAAIRDGGFRVVNCGEIPIPALAYCALQSNAPGVMITGSHIPADRNGIKFYKRDGEVLKEDETAIQEAVADVRQELYTQAFDSSAFDNQGNIKTPPELGVVNTKAEEAYINRYTDVFGPQSLADKKIVVYQHSSVGRDVLVKILERLGATVVPVERSGTFIPIDTENVTDAERALFQAFSQKNPDAFAVVSTDGDGDRPFVIDETGEFHRGDILGCITARYLGAKFAAVPISSNDAVNEFCEANGITLADTKIGSPYVIAAMLSAKPSQQPAVSWEVNGGFLVGNDIRLNSKTLKALPTRDAVLPILCALQAAREQNCVLSALFAQLPQRFTGGGLIDNVPEDQIQKFRALSGSREIMRKLAEHVFGNSNLGQVSKIDLTDGLRLKFQSGDVMHLRPSGNAPQFRVYSNASSQAHANELAEAALAPNGYIIHLLGALENISQNR